jgi:dipeptidyl aminopeptidase/acylaminoacyl peptidase
MARRLSERGAYCRTAYFDDEGHGFTRQASISKALGVELDFSLQRAATAVRSA